MPQTTLLIKYNKVTNEAFANLSQSLSLVKEADLAKFAEMMDTLPPMHVHNLLTGLLPFDNVVVGDIFWPSGQNICKWCKSHGKRC